MPSITVRSFAELLYLPAYEHLRILTEQKYPTSQPQSFMVPFYQTALNGIRAYYASGNDAQKLVAARMRASQLSNPSRRRNNERVLHAFARGHQSRRVLAPVAFRTIHAAPRTGVDLRLTFDLVAAESDRRVYIFYNTRASAIDPEVARATLRIAHWVLAENGIAVPYSSLEYVDLTSAVTHSVTRQSQRLLKQMRADARIISTLWPTI